MTTQITPGDLNSLAAKLDSMDLTEAEATLLRAILERAADRADDVGGFGYDASVATGGFGPLLSRAKVEFPKLKGDADDVIIHG